MKLFVKGLFGLSMAAVATSAGASTNGVFAHDVSDVPHLILECKADSAKLETYAHYFGMSTPGVIQYFNTLKSIPLEKDGLYAVYEPTKSGKFQAILMTLKAKRMIFVNSEGQPALLANGDPLTLGPGATAEKAATKGNSSGHLGADMVSDVRSSAAKDGSVASVEVASIQPHSFTQTELEPSNSLMAEPTVLNQASESSGAASITAGEIGLAAIGIGGIAAAISTHNGTGNVNTRPRLVPEPMTMVVLGAGLVGFMSRRKKV